MTAWQDGYESFHLGLSPDDCPYDGIEETAWTRGWKEAGSNVLEEM